jgi:hypothetical protein
MELIIISGPARVGKSTLANLIAKESFDLGLVPKLLSFADPLKREAKERGYTKDKTPEDYRSFCQELGSMRRTENPSHWVEAFEKDLSLIVEEEKEELEKGNPFWERCVIVDDCRYHNEVGMGIKYNATLIFMSPGVRDLPEADAAWRQHESEAMANDIEEGDQEQGAWFDYHLLNDGDAETLRVKTRAMAPIWCGVSAAGLTTNLDDADVTYDTEELEDMLSELIDILMKEFEDGEDPPVPDEGSD